MKIQVDGTIYQIHDVFFEKTSDILWSIIKLCNQDCIYCFETLKDNKCRMEKERDVYEYISAINKLDIYGYKKIHFCGGEILLKQNFANIIKCVNNMECVIITNLLFIAPQLFVLLLEGSIKRICVSLDSIDKNINDFLRGNTNIIISNILSILQYINYNCLNIEVNILCTLTKINIFSIKELLFWCKNNNINNILINPVSLMKDHQLYEQLAFKFGEESYLQIIEEIFELKKNLFKVDERDKIVFWLLQQAILHKKIEVINCPAITTTKYLYIEENGDIFNCPLRKAYFGNIFDDDLAIKRCNTSICEFCFQCLCYW